MNKKCTKCGEDKPLDAFGAQRDRPSGRRSRCKVCKNAVMRERYAADPEKHRGRARKWRTADPEKARERIRKWRTANPERAREIAHKADRKWCIANPEKLREKNREYHAERCRTDSQFRLRSQLRVRLRMALKHGYKSGSAVRDLGCSILELQAYLEAQFQPGMTWANHGKCGWHIDHIKPLVSFDLTNREQLLEAVHFSNLQPLWASENQSKGARIG